MWCHLCKKMFDDPEAFSVHIMKKHRLSSTFNEDNSDSEHSNQDETSSLEADEYDEIENNNSSEEDFFSDDKTSKNKSYTKAATPRTNARIKTKKHEFRNKTKVKNNTKLSVSKSSLKTNLKSPKKNKKLNLSQHKPSKLHKTVPDFNPENINSWLKQFKEMYKKSTLPLKPSLFHKIKTVHKQIFDNYCVTQSSKVTSAVLKVYEELDWVLHRNIISLNESL